jgi:hypothetical protein
MRVVAIHTPIRTAIQSAIGVARAVHVAVTSRAVQVVAPALLRILDARLFVPLSLIAARHGGIAATKDGGANNEYYQPGFHGPSPLP